MKVFHLLIVVLLGSVGSMAFDQNEDNSLNLSEGASSGYFHRPFFGSYGYRSYFGHCPYAHRLLYPYAHAYVHGFRSYDLCPYFPEIPECSQMQGVQMQGGQMPMGMGQGQPGGPAGMFPAGKAGFGPRGMHHRHGDGNQGRGNNDNNQPSNDNTNTNTPSSLPKFQGRASN